MVEPRRRVVEKPALRLVVFTIEPSKPVARGTLSRRSQAGKRSPDGGRAGTIGRGVWDFPGVSSQSRCRARIRTVRCAKRPCPTHPIEPSALKDESIQSGPNPTRTSVVIAVFPGRVVGEAPPFPNPASVVSDDSQELSFSIDCLAFPFEHAVHCPEHHARAVAGSYLLSPPTGSCFLDDPEGGCVAHDAFPPSRWAIFSARAARFASRSSLLWLHFDRSLISKRFPAPITTTSVPT